MATSSRILHSFLKDRLTENDIIAKVEDFPELCKGFLEYSRTNSEHRSDDFLPSLNFYLGVLGDTDKVMFEYMDEEQKKQLGFDLKITLLLLLAQQQHEIDYQKTENRKTYSKNIEQCIEYLIGLDPTYQNPAQAHCSKSNPQKYLGIALAKELVQAIVNCSDRKTKTVKELMGALNEKRLYWVWASSFLKTVIDLVPMNHPQSGKAAEAIRYPDPYTGCLSWTLYYARFALNLFLLLKHTIKHPWMSEEEAKTPWFERFQTQWDQRKFTLLNDSLWATSNLVCFFWLNGKSILGTWGDAITVVLLVFDLSIAIWDFEEQKTKYNKARLYYDEEIKEYDKKIKEIKQQLATLQQPEDHKNKDAILHQLEMQRHVLSREQAKCIREWHMYKISLISNMAYAVGLILAFVVLTMPFIPVAAPVAATLGLVGAVVCLALTVINNAIKGGIELYLTQNSRKEIQKEYALKVTRFMDDQKNRLLFLEIKKLSVEIEYQRQMLTYQTMNLVRTLILDVFIPVVIFASLICMPLTVGLLSFGAAVGLAIASHYLIDTLFKPGERKVLAFNLVEYDAFKLDEKKNHTFFKKTDAEKELPSSPDDSLDLSEDSVCSN